MNEQRTTKYYSSIDDDPITLEPVRPRSSLSRVQTDDDEQRENANLYPQRSHTTVKRYRPVESREAQQRQSYVVTRPSQQAVQPSRQSSTVNVHIRRRSTQTPRPLQQAPRTTLHVEREQEDDEPETQPLHSSSTPQEPKRRFHWLVPAGVGMVAMVLPWFVGLSVLSWWTTTLDDLHYGRPRTAQYDVRVGHNDAHTPSHFLALNLHGHIEVIEFPGGDASHAKVYLVSSTLQEGTTLPL